MDELQTQDSADLKPIPSRSEEQKWALDRERFVRSQFRGKLTNEALKHVPSKADLDLIRAVNERDLANTRIFVAPFMTATAIGITMIALGFTTGMSWVGLTGSALTLLASIFQSSTQVLLYGQTRRLDRIDEMLTRA